MPSGIYKHKPFSAATKIKISEALTGKKGHPSWNKGKTGLQFHTEATKKKIAETLSPKKIIHGFRFTRFYLSWANMKGRCLNKNRDNYKWYGGRGIKVCPKWLDFINFKNDMYESYLIACNQLGERNISLDRIDNNDNYFKNNCRWATMKLQCNNRNKRLKEQSVL